MSEVVVLVFAGNYRQAQEYAREHGLERWRYAADARSIYGLRNPDVRKVGTYYERRDFLEIEELIHRTQY